MIWFTADHHLGHTNIIEYCNRPFKNVDEMDSIMIDRWNEVVNPEDTVYHLGDLSLSKEWNVVISTYISRLNGNIIFIPGGHDKWLYSTNRNYTFVHKKFYVENPLITLNDNTPIILCHYAMRVWDRSHYNSWHLYGHSHGMLDGVGKSMDVGVDTNDFYPYSLDQIKSIMEKKPDNFNYIGDK